MQSRKDLHSFIRRVFCGLCDLCGEFYAPANAACAAASLAIGTRNGLQLT